LKNSPIRLIRGFAPPVYGEEGICVPPDDVKRDVHGEAFKLRIFSSSFGKFYKRCTGIVPSAVVEEIATAPQAIHEIHDRAHGQASTYE